MINLATVAKILRVKLGLRGSEPDTATLTHGILDENGAVVAYGRDGALRDAGGEEIAGGAGNPSEVREYTVSQFDRWWRIVDIPHAGMEFLAGLLYLEFATAEGDVTARGYVVIGDGDASQPISFTQLNFVGSAAYTDSTHEHGIRIHRRTGDGLADDRWRLEVFMARHEYRLKAVWTGGPLNFLAETAVIATDAARATFTNSAEERAKRALLLLGWGVDDAFQEGVVPYLGMTNDWLREQVWFHWALGRHGHFVFAHLKQHVGIRTNQHVHMFGTSGERPNLAVGGDVTSAHSRGLTTHDADNVFGNAHTHDGRSQPGNAAGAIQAFQELVTFEGGPFGFGAYDGGNNAFEWSNGTNLLTFHAIDTLATAPVDNVGLVKVYTTNSPSLIDDQIVRFRIVVNLAGINAANFIGTVTEPPALVSGVSPDPEELNGKYLTVFAVQGLDEQHWVPTGKALTQYAPGGGVEAYALNDPVAATQTSLQAIPPEANGSSQILKATYATPHGLLLGEPVVLLLTDEFGGLNEGNYTCNVFRVVSATVVLLVAGHARKGLFGDGGNVFGFTGTAAIADTGWGLIRGSRDRGHTQVHSEVWQRAYLAQNSGNNAIWQGAVNRGGWGRNVVLEGHESFGFGREIVTKVNQVALGRDLIHVGEDGDVLVGRREIYFRFKADGTVEKSTDEGATHTPLAPTHLRKAANESRTATTTFANDDTLQWVVVAGEKWTFEMVVFAVQATPDPGMKFALAGPAGEIFATGEGVHSNGILGFSPVAMGGFFDVTAGNYLHSFTLRGSFAPSATGTASLQWAQSTSSAQSVTVRAGSYALLQKH